MRASIFRKGLFHASLHLENETGLCEKGASLKHPFINGIIRRSRETEISVEMSTLGMVILRALVDREEVSGILHRENRGNSESSVKGCLLEVSSSWDGTK